jgi:hypothetical protein
VCVESYCCVAVARCCKEEKGTGLNVPALMTQTANYFRSNHHTYTIFPIIRIDYLSPVTNGPVASRGPS